MKIRRMQGGFTMIEMLAVLAIIGIISAALVPVGLNISRDAQKTHNENIARSIYLVAQNAFSNYRNSGRLGELVGFDGETPTVSYIQKGVPAGPDVSFEDRMVPKDPAFNDEDNIFYFKTGYGNLENADAAFNNLLEPYIADKTILNHTILVEFNARTGIVKSVFYSPDHDAVYGGTGDREIDIAVGENRVSSHKMGYYGVESSGTVEVNPDTISIGLFDDGESDARYPWSKNMLYVEAHVPYEWDIPYTIEILDADTGSVITAPDGRTMALTFSAGTEMASVKNASLQDALIKRYQDIDAGEHLGTESPVVFMAGVEDTMATIIWVLDYVDPCAEDPAEDTPSGEHMPSLRNSIGCLYPEIGAKMIRAKITFSLESAISAISDKKHSMYLRGDVDVNGIVYGIMTARHLNNVRYNADSAFRQLDNIDLAEINNFVPLSWTPKPGTQGSEFVPDYFSGNYSGIQVKSGETTYFSYISNLKISNVNSAYSSIGLFGDIKGAMISHLTIGCPEALSGGNGGQAVIRSDKGGNVGTVAGSAEGSELLNMAVLANIEVSNNNQESTADTNVGGLVGLQHGDNSLIRFSYNGGYFDASGTRKIPMQDRGYIKVTGHEGLSGIEINIGGIVGKNESIGLPISYCYNTARINIESATYIPGGDGDDRFQSANPVACELKYAELEKVCIGGVIGKSLAGYITNIYSINFVAEYHKPGNALIKSKSGALAGHVESTEATNWFAIKNNNQKLFNSADNATKAFMTKEDFSKKSAGDSSWVNGTEYGSVLPSGQSLPAEDSYSVGPIGSAANHYPYRTLKDNPHVFYWEDIYDAPSTFTSPVRTYFQTGRTVFEENYRDAYIETAHIFTEAGMNEIEVTISWYPDIYSIDSTNQFIKDTIAEGAGGRMTASFTAQRDALYIIRFYSKDPAQAYEIPTNANERITFSFSAPGTVWTYQETK